MKMEISELIYKRIIELLEKDKLNINKFCKQNNIPPTTIYSIKDGKSTSPSIKNIIKICNGLNISLYDFFNDDSFKEKRYNNK